MPALRPHPDLLNQNLHFHQLPRGCIRSLRNAVLWVWLSSCGQREPQMVVEQGCERLCKDLRHRGPLREKGGGPGSEQQKPFLGAESG